MLTVQSNQGEELRKQIGATYYIECSSKTQQVMVSNNFIFISHVQILNYCSDMANLPP